MRTHKKGIICGIFIVIIMLAISSISYAASENSLKLGVVFLRESGYGYQIGGKKVPKIIQYRADGTSHTWDESIYCLKAEKGFMQLDSKETTAIYNKSLNMKSDTIPKGYLEIGENLPQVLWILDNSYLPLKSTEEQKVALLKIAGIQDSQLTDEDIEVVQQLAIWYYTNSEDRNYHTDNLVDIKTNLMAGLDSNLIELEKQEGSMRLTQMNQLYHYFINAANTDASLYAKEGEKQLPAPVTVQKTTPSMTLDESGNMIVGPYEIKKNTNAPYTLQAVVTDQKNRELMDYTILTANGEKLEGKEGLDKYIQTKQNGETVSFYLEIPANRIEVTQVELKTQINYYPSSITFWTNGATFAKQQPVAIVQKEEKMEEQTIHNAIHKFDLSLKAAITDINGQSIENRLPQMSYDESTGKIIYSSVKDPIAVKNGDTITYTFCVYNEGTIDGYASKLIANIPEGLSFIIDNDTNLEYNWSLSEDLKSLSTNYLTKPEPLLEDNAKIPAFDKDTMTQPAYKEVKLVLKVVERNASDRILINQAEIGENLDKDGNLVQDVDSTPNNGVLGEDDIDIEKVRMQQYDLALKTFVSKVGENEITSRIPKVSTNLDTMEFTYQGVTTPLEVKEGQTITYTVRIYNEGDMEGYAKKIAVTIPEGLELVTEDAVNQLYGWQKTEDGRWQTDYLSKEKEETSGTSKIKAFDGVLQKTPDYRDVKIVVKVKREAISKPNIYTIAEIIDDSDGIGNEVTDRDSIPNNKVAEEDDISAENIKVVYMDLAMKQFITKVGGLEVNNRIPQVKYLPETNTWEYQENKSEMTVMNQDTIYYTARVYNEGNMDGIASRVRVTIPDGLVWNSENEINKKYGWKLQEDGKTIETDYLADKPINKTIDRKTPSYQEIQYVLKVEENNANANRIANSTIEITETQDKQGEVVEDVDYTVNTLAADNISRESVRIGKFALSTQKGIQSITIKENGQEETLYEAGEKKEKNIVLDISKKDLKDKQIKVKYQITVVNKGDISGYASEIKDTIPEGLIFEEQENTSWRMQNGEIITNQLAAEKLEPGESKTVEVSFTYPVETKINTIILTPAQITKAVNRNDAQNQETNSESNITIKVQKTNTWIWIMSGAIVLLVIGTVIGIIIYRHKKHNK